MSQINLTDSVFYKDGVPGQSKVVGFESGVTRVARYTFTAPDTGGTELTFRLDGVSKGSGADISLRFALSTDPEAYTNAGANSPYTGKVTLALWDYAASGAAQVRLLPKTTYYLWLFPGENIWGWYYVPATGTVTVSGISQGIALAEDGILGQPIPITIHSAGGYTHTLTWQFGGLSGVVGTDLGTAVTWTPPLTLANAIPNSPSGLCTFLCYSYLDGVQEGPPQSSAITLTVPDFMAPQVVADATDTSEASSALGYLVEKVSKLELAVSTTVFYGATVTATAITLDGAVYAGGALPAGDHTLAVTITDSRGLAGRWEQALAVAAYTPPQLEVNASRCQADGTADDTGSYALVTLRGAVTAIPGNTAALTLTYGTTAQPLSVEVGAFQISAIIPADPNETLYIKARVTDALKGTTRTMTLSTGYPTMEFLAGGKGIAFGQVATREGFQCGMDAYFSGKVMDGQGRTLWGRYDLTAVTGMYLTPFYGRLLEVLGTGFLQLKFTCNRNRAAGDQLFSGSLPITEDLAVTDVTGKYTLTLTPTGVVTPNALPTGTYTFDTLLY